MVTGISKVSAAGGGGGGLFSIHFVYYIILYFILIYVRVQCTKRKKCGPNAKPAFSLALF
jgi:hypothetical protein